MNLLLIVIIAVCLAIAGILFWQSMEKKSFNDSPFDDDVKKREDEQIHGDVPRVEEDYRGGKK